MIKPKPQFGKAKPLLVHRKDPFAASAKWNAEHEERAAIHEFDGQLSRPEAEARAARECQHCGKPGELQSVFKADYGYSIRVCAGCAGELAAKGWVEGDGEERF